MTWRTSPFLPHTAEGPRRGQFRGLVEAALRVQRLTGNRNSAALMLPVTSADRPLDAVAPATRRSMGAAPVALAGWVLTLARPELWYIGIPLLALAGAWELGAALRRRARNSP